MWLSTMIVPLVTSQTGAFLQRETIDTIRLATYIHDTGVWRIGRVQGFILFTLLFCIPVVIAQQSM